MRAVTAPEPGGPEALVVTDRPDPVAGPGEVVIEMSGTAINRADTLQRQGFYPPPPGASDVLGLECSGTVSSVGAGVDAWSVGDEVCALLSGGGYAERVLVPAGQAMPVPAGVDLVAAGALPEVGCTVWSNVFMVAGLQRDETLLVHGGAGGIGSFAIQLARALGARVVTTAGSPEKLEVCRSLGADVAVSYREQDFVEEVRSATDGGGADVILDNMGAKYLGRNIDALATEGRLVVIGMQGGSKGELDLGALMRKRGAVISTSLRARPVEEKAAICASTVEHVWPLVADGSVRTLVHATLPLAEAAEGHRIMEAGDHVGRSCSLRKVGPMTSQNPEHAPEDGDDPRVMIIGPDGMAMAGGPAPSDDGSDGEGNGDGERNIAELVEQPAKVMRIGGMIRQLLEEVKSAPLDEASRTRLADIYESSIKELEGGLAPELVEELERLSLPFSSETPSEAELRIAQAQLVGGVEGVFHGIQTAIYAQQVAARAQLEEMRRALPSGVIAEGQMPRPGQMGHPGHPEEQGNRGGMYL